MAIHQRGKFFVDFLGSIRQFIVGGNAQPGGANTQVNLTKNIAGMVDATFTTIFTVTVPNLAMAAACELTLIGSLGAGGAIGAFESSNAVFGLIAIARTPGVATVAVASALTNSAVASVAGADNAAVTYQVSAMTGAVGATQTFNIQVKVTKSAGASAAHSLVAVASLLNSQATGITIS